MKTMTQFQPETTLDRDSLLLASAILLDVSQTVSSIQSLVHALLRFVTMGIAITNWLTSWVAPVALNEQ